MSIFYRPENAVLGDVIPFYDDGVFKPFYLRNFRGNRDMRHRDSWVMLTTKDHVHFTEHDTGISGGTGSVIKVGGIYHMFYCTFRRFPERNYINHAISRDLDTWTEIPEDCFPSDDGIYGSRHWRDPFVFWNEEEQCWWMINAAQKKGPTTRTACVGLCKSDDLHHWRYCEPLYAPANAQCAFECPDLFRMGDWYYLVFSSYADRFQTLYRMSRSLNGPWLTPEIDTFDTRAFYAAKTGSDGHRRFIYGWNPTRENDEHLFDPPHAKGHDWKSWDWGGSLIVHEIRQMPGGELFVEPLPEVLEAFCTEQKLDLQPLSGPWRCEGNACSVQSGFRFSALQLNRITGPCRLSLDVELTERTREFGISVQTDGNFSEGYYINLEPCRKRVEFRSTIRMTETGGQSFPYEIELERPLPADTGNRYHFDILIEDTVLEVYVNHQIALGTRVYDRTGGCFGLYVSNGAATFSGIQYCTVK